MKRKEYVGQDITVTFDMSKCIHARNCFLKLPEAFDPAQRPWVQPDKAPAEEVAAMIRSCPSGALGFRYNDGAAEAPPKLNRIAVLENGPLAVAGDLDIEGDETTRATLCRCGLSKNKPYCDYSHVEAGFAASGEPKPKTPDPVEETGGHVTAARVPDGPLKVAGNVELTTGTGHKIVQGKNVFLCRCGASNNKPFCDGSHKDIGFEDRA